MLASQKEEGVILAHSCRGFGSPLLGPETLGLCRGCTWWQSVVGGDSHCIICETQREAAGCSPPIPFGGASQIT